MIVGRRALLAGGVGLAVAGCRAAAVAQPALWRVEGAGRLWLFGAMHALPDDDWVSAPLERAIAEAGELVLEVAPGDDPAAAFAARARLPAAVPLGERLPEVMRPVLAEVIARLRIDPDALDREASWAAALVIGGAASAQAGARRENGTEAVLAAAFARAGKPVRALETAAGQLAAFTALPEAQQRLLLGRTVADAAAPGQFAALVTAWRAGDLATLAARLAAGVEGAPSLREALVTDRSRRFAAWAAARLRRPGSALLAVGAGHLVGADGVPALLARDGIAVRRVA